MRILWIAAVVVLIDQVTKAIVVNTMYIGQSIPLIGDWLRLTFTENPGMAFGITFGPRPLVTILSIVATILIIGYMYTVRTARPIYRASLAMILGGALGNIIDRVFYGVIQGYDGFFVGRVVDFIHVNLWRGYIPDEVPFFGGSYVALFPIWNVADMAIVVGVVGILLFQNYALPASDSEPSLSEEVDPEIDTVSPSMEASMTANGHPDSGPHPAAANDNISKDSERIV